MEVPDQFKALQGLGLIGKKVKGPLPSVKVLEPPAVEAQRPRAAK